MVRHRQTPAPDRARFWLQEAREADQLLLLAASFPEAAATGVDGRPLVSKAIEGDREGLELALMEEQVRGKAADRTYWAPLLAELEEMRRARRRP